MATSSEPRLFPGGRSHGLRGTVEIRKRWLPVRLTEPALTCIGAAPGRLQAASPDCVTALVGHPKPGEAEFRVREAVGGFSGTSITTGRKRARQPRIPVAEEFGAYTNEPRFEREAHEARLGPSYVSFVWRGRSACVDGLGALRPSWFPAATGPLCPPLWVRVVGPALICDRSVLTITAWRHDQGTDALAESSATDGPLGSVFVDRSARPTMASPYAAILLLARVDFFAATSTPRASTTIAECQAGRRVPSTVSAVNLLLATRVPSAKRLLSTPWRYGLDQLEPPAFCTKPALNERTRPRPSFHIRSSCSASRSPTRIERRATSRRRRFSPVWSRPSSPCFCNASWEPRRVRLGGPILPPRFREHSLNLATGAGQCLVGVVPFSGRSANTRPTPRSSTTLWWKKLPRRIASSVAPRPSANSRRPDEAIQVRRPSGYPTASKVAGSCL